MDKLLTDLRTAKVRENNAHAGIRTAELAMTQARQELGDARAEVSQAMRAIEMAADPGALALAS